jgi:hypothetical protein
VSLLAAVLSVPFQLVAPSTISSVVSSRLPRALRGAGRAWLGGCTCGSCRCRSAERSPCARTYLTLPPATGFSLRRWHGARATGMRSSRRPVRRYRVRGIAVTPSRQAARSHSCGRSRGDGGCGTGPLARYRLAPRRREIRFGRQCDHVARGAPRTRAIAGRHVAAMVDSGRCICPTAITLRSSQGIDNVARLARRW